MSAGKDPSTAGAGADSFTVTWDNEQQRHVSWDGTTCKETGCNMSGNHWPDKQRFPPKGHGIAPSYWLNPDDCPERDEHFRVKYADRLTWKVHSSRDGATTSYFIDGKPVKQALCVCGLYVRHREAKADV
jgi:hypothetical protein